MSVDIFKTIFDLVSKVDRLEKELAIIKKQTGVGSEVSVKDIATLSGKTVQTIHYRLFNTPGVEPEKDFKKIGKGYMINTNCLGRLLNG